MHIDLPGLKHGILTEVPPYIKLFFLLNIPFRRLKKRFFNNWYYYLMQFIKFAFLILSNV